jgi:hypothetical protein
LDKSDVPTKEEEDPVLERAKTFIENIKNYAGKWSEIKLRKQNFSVLRYLVWVITINFWGLCPQTSGVYRLNTNPEEVKRGQQ